MNTPECPTPAKARYATREAAVSAALRQRLALDKLLTPYECETACGWWHLTSKARTAPAAADIAAVHALDDDAFRQLVIRDAEYRAPRAHSDALRDPSLLHRWINTLRLLKRDLNRQHNAPGISRAEGAAVAELLAKVTDRHTHAAELVAKNGACVAVPARNADTAKLRAAAGDLAVDRLIAAHRSEFTDLLIEEYERLGLDIPERIRRHQQRHLGAAS